MKHVTELYKCDSCKEPARCTKEIIMYREYDLCKACKQAIVDSLGYGRPANDNAWMYDYLLTMDCGMEC